VSKLITPELLTKVEHLSIESLPENEKLRREYLEWARNNFGLLNPISTHCSMCGERLAKEDIIPPKRVTYVSYKYLIFSCPKCGTVNAKQICLGRRG